MKTIYKYSFRPGIEEKIIEVELAVKDGKLFKKWGEKWGEISFIPPKEFRGIIWLILKLEDCPAEFANYGYLGIQGHPRINQRLPLPRQDYKRGLKLIGLDAATAEAIQKAKD